ncbi:MAG TPA: DUF4386 family protein, partial [Candidatus Udaeobacter sp.]|nr:DUF4386 family protein [Candidatus Udaeobacter sp.]
IPKTLACFGVIASAWCVICAFIFLVFPSFNKVVNDYIFDTPMAIFEMVVSLWLLFKGLRPARTPIEFYRASNVRHNTFPIFL